MGKSRIGYLGSYRPLGPPEDDGGRLDALDQGVAVFFQQVSDMAFKGGPLGIELTRLDAVGQTFTFRKAPEPDPLVLAGEAGAVPADDRERAGTEWAPLPASPAWAHLAWLLAELPAVQAFREYGPEGGPALRGVVVPSRRWADVLVEHRGEEWRVRVALQGRTEPIEFPGMAIGELFGEGRHRRLAVAGEPNLVASGI
ncbi:hypothetical protein [Streptomyces sp. NPDC004134]|uniref:hypothetical protein n=1 Tax=Streptomyces sp. NPDC004134 TaxID=3364691 RepID=UPI0036B2006F